MQIININRDGDVKKVIASSKYGYDYVELKNGAKVIINRTPVKYRMANSFF